jgi:hypothetical protein
MASGYQGLSTTRGEKKFRLQMTAGTSGAVPTTFTRARGIASVVKSTNDYIITLSKGYTALLDCRANVLQASSSTTGAWEAKMTAEDVATNKTITISPYTAAGAAVALATGDILRVDFTLKTSPGLA